MDFFQNLIGPLCDDTSLIQEALKNGAIIIDVRAPFEFANGHPAGAQNIPLKDIPLHLEDIKKLAKPIVLCCASGARSADAKRYLTSCGIAEVYNAGPWRNIPC